MRVQEVCNRENFWYSLLVCLSLSVVRTATLTIAYVIQAWYIFHKPPRSVQYGKLLLKQNVSEGSQKLDGDQETMDGNINFLLDVG